MERAQVFMGRRKTLRYGLLIGNVILLAGIVTFVISGNNQHSSDVSAVSSVAHKNAASDPLDQLSSADIAASLSKTVRLPEATAVTNQADTVSAEMAVTPADNNLVAKPQVVSTALKSRRDIQSYVVAAGDSITSIAAKFNITSDSVRWSNSLTGDAVTVGAKLTIPPVNGIVYTIKNGDTAQTLASRYSANADQITSFNDAELGGLKIGEQILIPNGQQPVVIAASSSYVSRGSASYGSGGSCNFKGQNYQNYGYDCGYCTWWVAMKRAMAGEPVPSNLGNASSWGYLAASYGISTGTTPQVGAAVVTSTAGAGHVAYVEAVNDDGTITISEMNHEGWNVSDTRSIPAGRYTYIY